MLNSCLHIVAWEDECAATFVLVALLPHTGCVTLMTEQIFEQSSVG
jgi:hypothetical protein